MYMIFIFPRLIWCFTLVYICLKEHACHMRCSTGATRYWPYRDIRYGAEIADTTYCIGNVSNAIRVSCNYDFSAYRRVAEAGNQDGYIDATCLEHKLVVFWREKRELNILDTKRKHEFVASCWASFPPHIVLFARTSDQRLSHHDATDCDSKALTKPSSLKLCVPDSMAIPSGSSPDSKLESDPPFHVGESETGHESHRGPVNILQPQPPGDTPAGTADADVLEGEAATGHLSRDAVAQPEIPAPVGAIMDVVSNVGPSDDGQLGESYFCHRWDVDNVCDTALRLSE